MSLINDMLRDLETRRSDELQRQNLQGEIRPLPMLPSRSRWPLLVLGGAIVAALAGGAVVWWNSRVTLTSKPPVVMVSAPQAVVSPPALSALQIPAVSAAAAETAAPPQALSAAAVPAVSPVPTAAIKPPLPAPGAVPVATVAPVKDEKPEKPAVLPRAEPAAKKNEPSPLPEKPLKPAKAAVEAPKGGNVAVAREKEAGAGKIEVKAILATPRERADGDYRRAQGLIAAGQGDEAVHVLRSALKHDAEYTPARQLLIRQLIEQKHWDEAVAVLGEGLELQPKQTGWAISLARLQVEKNDLAGAARTLSRFEAAAANNADYAGFQAHIQYRLGHYREAAVLYQKLTKLAAGEGRWWFGLGVSLEAEGRAGEAREAFRQALATGTLNNELSAQATQRLR